MIGVTFYLLVFAFFIEHSFGDTWTNTTTNCLWNQWTNHRRLSKRVDLRDIRNQVLMLESNDSFIYFNPCKTFNLPLGADPYLARGEQCHNVLGCRQSRSNNFTYPIAIRLNATVLPEKSILTIKYFGSKSYANRSFLVQFECNRGVYRARFELVKDQTDDEMPLFTLTHRCCCPNVCGGNTFPKGLLFTLLMVILFIISTAIWIFFQCRRHYPERNTYGAIETANININALDPGSVLKGNSTENKTRADSSSKRTRSRSIVPAVADNCIISSQDFKILHRLGVGELGGEVSEGRWNDKLIAIKTLRIGIHPDKFTEDDKTYLENSLGQLCRLRQKNLTTILGICFDIDLYPRIILSFAEHGTIIEFLTRSPTKVDWSLRLNWCVQTADAMSYLHQSNVLHRNLKSSNILITFDSRVQVCDYGLMSLLQPLRQACDSERCLCKLSHAALPISIRWSAPEILADPSDSTRFQPSIDVYSFGVCLWEQIRLEQPYAEIKDEAEVLRWIVEGHRLPPFDELTLVNVMPEYNQLMFDCWKEMPTERPTFEQIGRSLRQTLTKVKSFQKHSMKRMTSTMTNMSHPNENSEEQQSLLSRFDSRISGETPKNFHKSNTTPM